MVLIASSLALLIAYSAASPIPRDLESTVVGWIPEPEGRGTFSIFSSCVLTLSLCVYTAIHLNVPGINESRAVRFFRTARWVVLGIFAPELVVWTAWRQWASARGVARLVNRQQATSHSPFESIKRRLSESLLHQKSPPIDSSKIPTSGAQRSQTFYNPERWTTIHGFYAGMGGFVFDLPYTMDGHEHKSQDQFTRLTLTAEGVEFLARCGLLPEITVEEIVDKSKADSLSKFLACLQALWMLVQVLGRVATDLPVTLIEVNTLAHVVCALITYVLWWHKPKEIHSPTRLQGDWIGPVCSYMYMTSKMSGWKKQRPGLLSKSWNEPEISLLVFVPDSQNQEKKATIREEGVECANETFGASPARLPNDAHPGGVRFRPSPLNDTNRRGILTGSFRPRPEVCPSYDDDEMKHQITQLDRLRSSSISASSRWALAAEAVATYPYIFDYLVDPKVDKPDSQADYLEPVKKELLVPYSSNHSSEGLIREFNGTVVGTVLWFSCAAFGAIHVAAWDAFFPSKLEMWLWRSSGVFIAFSGLLWLGINGLASMSKRFDTLWESVLAMKAKGWIYGGIGVLSGVCGICFVFSRAYLVLEAFISLRSLPPGAYETPDWTQVIPHL
ncbi:hypothetical protein MMC10_000971 [Thelotrema lepadinum]|nr:hypothetical protein [Thelotrema lepadinum]